MGENISLIKYEDSFKNEWDNHIRNSKNPHFFFLRDFIEYHENRFKEHSLIIKRGKKVAAVLPGNIDNDTFYSYQGLTFGGLIVNDKIRAANTGDIIKMVIDYLKELGVSKMIYKKMPFIYNEMPYEEDVYHLVKNGAKLSYAEIGQVIDYSDFKISSTRDNEINRGKKAGIQITVKEKYEGFWKVLIDNLRKHGATPTHTLEEIQYLADKFPKNIKLYCAEKEGEILCGTVLFINKQVVHTQYIGSSDDAHEYNALEYLLGEMISEFKDKKYFSFGISTEEKGKTLNNGLAFFKEGFGARGVLNTVYEFSI
ncbi:MAG: GNAT family N-acetyltransferase [Candidatus Paceibacterota bacterium]